MLMDAMLQQHTPEETTVAKKHTNEREAVGILFYR
jgi:hypothetical protein